MSISERISRREALRRFGVLAGGALSSSTVSALLAGCQANASGADWTPAALSTAQRDVLTTVVDRILPRTDTPGASEVGVPQFIDLLLSSWAEEDERARVLAGLDELGAGFLSESAEVQTTILTDLDAEAAAAREARSERARARARAAQAAEGETPSVAEPSDGADPSDDADDTEIPLPWFATLKEWTLVGYYTSQVGATQELQWLPAPGRYESDLPLTEVGRTWA